MTSQVMAGRPPSRATVRTMSMEGFGPLLRRWRANRRLSQEQLAFDAGVSTRHLSCLETGKAQPSRAMVLALAGTLELELRERNVLLGSAGFAPHYSAAALDSLELEPVRRAVELILQQQEPYGAVLFDRCWNVLRLNRGAERLFATFLGSHALEPRITSNLVRAALHPDALRPSIVNWTELAALLLERLTREHAQHPGDSERAALLAEVRSYPGIAQLESDPCGAGAPFATVHLRRGGDEVRLFTLLTTLGTPLDTTAQELTLETYFPADSASEAWLRR